jgi:hypothetical protein
MASNTTDSSASRPGQRAVPGRVEVYDLAVRALGGIQAGPVLIEQAQVAFLPQHPRRGPVDELHRSWMPAPVTAIPPGQAGQLRCTWNGAKLCVTGIISIVLMLTCAGCDTTQYTASAMSAGTSGCMPA